MSERHAGEVTRHGPMWLPIVVVLVLAVLAGGAFLHWAANRPPPPPSVTVEVTKVTVQPMPEHLRLPGPNPGRLMTVAVSLMVRNRGNAPIPVPGWPTLLPTPDTRLARLFADGQEVECAEGQPSRATTRMPQPPITPGSGTGIGMFLTRVPEDARELELVLSGEPVGQKGEIRVKVPIPER
jgi:hypothetical protein